MSEINFKGTVSGTVDAIIPLVTDALQSEGFGVLTRIDLHQKFKEKLNKDVAPAVILGACNPQLAYDAYIANPDVSSLLPCNVVIRELRPGTVSVELARPTAMMEVLGEARLVALAKSADEKLQNVLRVVQRKRAS